ncbi:MAG TPA: endonuclease/exonuclease/phosphatase family protein [Pyrinomonadaceae bacterium]|nr:endonuclease/exonuclease/phosphatase family protein [Pyrinomonadaceae bacterium]
MRLRQLFPLCVVLFLLVCASSATANTVRLRVVSWNIAFGKGTDNVTDYNRIATWLARMSPDVIALCEIPPDRVSEVKNLLSQKTGRVWNSHFVPKSPGTPEGNLILSTYSFSALDARYLSYNRSIAQATINVGGRNVNFFATHLDHTSSALRLTQAVELISWTSSFASPRIVAGDLNAGNDTAEILRLLTSFRDSWVDALNANSAFAYPDNPVWLNTRTRRWRIDFILYSADTSTFIARRGEIPDSRDLSNTNVVNKLGTPDDNGVRPSDHNIVVSDFEVLTTSAPAPPPPASPVLLTQGTSDRAIAMHSTLFTDEPFSVRSPVNMSSDQRTRIMLFATNLDLLAGETTSSVSVRAKDSRGISYDLPVEQVNKVPNFAWLSVVIVKLPDDTTITGDLVVTVGLRGAVSNSARVGIR